MEQNNKDNLFELQVDHQATAYLGDTARWAKFLAIIGFIACGLIVLMAIFAGSFIAGSFGRLGGESGISGAGGLAAAGGAFFTILYLAIAVLYFFPCLYLFNFAKKMQIALRSNDQEQLNHSFRNLKALYRFLGILAIIGLGFWALGIIFAIIGSAFH
jgi:hypothetical protein